MIGSAKIQQRNILVNFTTYASMHLYAKRLLLDYEFIILVVVDLRLKLIHSLIIL